jgi:hypothetical protein
MAALTPVDIEALYLLKQHADKAMINKTLVSYYCSGVDYRASRGKKANPEGIDRCPHNEPRHAKVWRQGFEDAEKVINGYGEPNAKRKLPNPRLCLKRTLYTKAVGKYNELPCIAACLHWLRRYPAKAVFRGADLVQ